MRVFSQEFLEKRILERREKFLGLEEVLVHLPGVSWVCICHRIDDQARTGNFIFQPERVEKIYLFFFSCFQQPVTART